MSKKTRIIILSVLAVLIVVVLSVSITTAFMKPIDQGGNITEVSLSSCAKIKLEGTTSIKLTNSYPMSRNKGLQTTPYTFTVTSYCDTYVGFNLYLATINTNTLSASNIHYIITEKGSKEALVEGTLTSSLDDASNFTDAEKTELNAGLSGTYGNIFKLYNNKIPYKGSATYDLYLFVDENATEYQNTTFAAGVAVKSYERERNTFEACSNGQNLAECIKSTYSYDTTLYYHDSDLEDGAKDNSYRYSGGQEACTYNGEHVTYLDRRYDETENEAECRNVYKETQENGNTYYYNGKTKNILPLTDTATWDTENNKCVTSINKYDVRPSYGDEITQQYCEGKNVMYSDELKVGVIFELVGEGKWESVSNYVCFGSDEVECPEDNLYRIIGVFDTQVKLVKAEPASSKLLGTDGAYNGEYDYFWNNATKTNIWSESNLNKINLNTNYINNLGIKWTSKIFDATWIVGGINVSMGDTNTSQDFYSLEVVNPFTSSNIEFKYTPAMALTNGTSSKIGLPYISDYLFAKKKDYWGDIYSGSYSDSWMAIEGDEWTITRYPNDTSGVLVIRNGSAPGTFAAAGVPLPIKPTFYLKPDVNYISGSGTKNDPIIIN